jgi:uncharacterized protein YjbI with pentapeptide repeats
MIKDYSGKNLCGQSFRGQDLTGAIFTKSSIIGADFTSSILKNAILVGVIGGLQKAVVNYYF